MQLGRKQPAKRLRKQPKMRRMEAASYAAQPQLTVPKTAKKRKKRNSRKLTLPTAGIRQLIFSPRWLSLFLLTLTAAALFLIGMDEKFYLTTLPVEGATAIPASEVVTASHLAGRHIFAVDPRTAAEQIMSVPGITAARVTVRWPNVVQIQVQEDSPIALWVEEGEQYWVTRHGRLLPARSAGLGLLIIESEISGAAATAATPTTDAEGNPVEPTADVAFVPHSALLGAMQLRELRPNIERLYYSPGPGLSYQDGRGWRAYFGTGDDMAQKLVMYETIVDDLLAKGITPTYISVVNQERPFYQGQ
jgi:hypothetical protein